MVVPRTSRYVIELSVEERDELERRAREVTAPWRGVQGARMILGGPSEDRNPVGERLG